MCECRLLCEVHEEYETNIKLAKQGYFVYDFALPLLLLHAFTFHSAENLANWLRICPRRQITVLDTHDGMGIDDISGLAPVSPPCSTEQYSVYTSTTSCSQCPAMHIDAHNSMYAPYHVVQSVAFRRFLNAYNSA